MIASPVAASVVFSAKGFALAHGGPLGTSWALFRSPKALAPDASGCAGGVGAHGAAPSIAESGGEVVVAFVEDGRPYLFAPGAEEPRLLALDGKAHAVAVDLDGAHARVVAADDDGLYAVPVTIAPSPVAGPVERWVERGDVRAPLRVVRLGDARLVLYAVSDAALGVVHVAPDGARRDVRYGVDAPCVHVACASNARQAAVALAWNGDEVHRALFDASGRTIERPHAGLRVPGASFGSAQAVWVGRRFAVGGVDVTDGTCLLDGNDGAPPIALRGFGAGPLALARTRDHFFGVQVAADEAQLGVAIRTVAPDGQGEGGVRWFVPDGSPAREARRRAADLLRALHAELARGSYRDPAAISIDVDALALRVAGASGDGDAMVLRLAPAPDAFALELEVDEPDEPPTFGERIARLVTGAVPGAERSEAWIRELCEGLIELTEVVVAVAGGRRTLRLVPAALPTGAAVAALLTRARKSARAGTR